MKFYRIEEIAEKFGRSPTTIRRWIREGRFPHGKPVPGGQIWTESSLERWINLGQTSEKEMQVIAESQLYR